MAITTDDTDWEGMDSNGVMTATRHITIPAGDMKQLDLAESNDIPQIGDAHPENSAWTVYSIGNIQYADIPKEYRIPIKYRRASGGGIPVTTSNERAPWDNGIINHHISSGTLEVPLIRLFRPDLGKYIDLTNSAGQRIPVTSTIQYRIDTFQINVKKGSKSIVLAAPGTLNCNDEQLFDQTVAPYSGKIMKMDAEPHVVYQNNGRNIKWEYYTISYEIHWFPVKDRKWVMSFLNVGTKFMRTINGKKVPSRIFQYTPWKSADPEVNARVEPKFGSINAVIAARRVYQKALKDAKEDYAQDIPWEEASDIPLVLSTGAIDTAAIAGEKEYDQISGFERKGVSWSKYIPEEARTMSRR